MKTLKKFENWIDDTTIVLDENFSEEDNHKKELRRKINELIDEYERNYGTYNRINYEGGW